MSGDSHDQHPIETKAAEFLTRRDAGWSADDAAEFELWRASDPAHEAAVRKIEATQQLLTRLPESPGAAAMLREVEHLCRPRRRGPIVWWRGAAAIAAAACVALVVWWTRPHRDTAPLVYAAAEASRTVDLSDGSTLRMNAASTLEVRFDPGERRIELRNGTVHFAVAKDPTRPFVVTAGNISVRAVGTAFNIRYDAAEVAVAVTEGKVRVSPADPADASSAPPLFLVAGEGATFTSKGTIAGSAAMRPAGAADLGRHPWHAPRLEFSNSPLADVIERFNQYSRVQVELGDAALASRPVGGTFDADQSEVFVNLLVAAGDVRVERVSETHLILRQAR